jgi:thiol-disulfide isomerase/thioredoxin
MKPIEFISKLLLAIILFTAVALGPAFAGPPLNGWMEQFTPIDTPKPVPQTGFFDGAAKGQSLTDFKGRVVLVNFWATWCAPCVRELPSLDRLQADMGGKDFTVVAVSIDRGGAKTAEPFLRKKLGLSKLGLYIDKRLELSRALGVKGMPTSFLIDRRGNIRGSLTGIAEWDDKDAKALIRHYMKDGG